MKLYQLATTGIYGICAVAYADDTIAIQHSHPLSALAIELQQRYSYAVTYEEAPVDTANMQTQRLPNGSSFISAPTISIVFQMPAVTVGEPVPAAVNRVPAGLPDVVLPLVAKYNQAGNGATFSALFEGGYAHIVPANRIMNGKAVPFQPILGTMVTMNVKASSCSDALDSLLAQVSAARGVRLVRGITPIGPLMQHECSLTVSSLPARNVLASILDQVGTGAGHPSPKTLYSWTLLYDPNTNKYFLSTSMIPDLNPKQALPAPPAAPATSTTNPSAPSRMSVPAVKKQ
jgi:hypothetical protein